MLTDTSSVACHSGLTVVRSSVHRCSLQVFARGRLQGCCDARIRDSMSKHRVSKNQKLSPHLSMPCCDPHGTNVRLLLVLVRSRGDCSWSWSLLDWTVDRAEDDDDEEASAPRPTQLGLASFQRARIGRRPSLVRGSMDNLLQTGPLYRGRTRRKRWSDALCRPVVVDAFGDLAWNLPVPPAGF